MFQYQVYFCHVGYIYTRAKAELIVTPSLQPQAYSVLIPGLLPKHVYLNAKISTGLLRTKCTSTTQHFKGYLEFTDGVPDLSREIHPKSFILSIFTFPNDY